MDPYNMNNKQTLSENRVMQAVAKEKTSQCDDLLNYLRTWDHGITRMEAFAELGICELSSRIGELEKKGYIFKKLWVKGRARNGRRYQIKRYFLVGWPNES